jgi:hypothetical protein
MNKIKIVLERKGIQHIRPSDSLLDRMGVKVHTWNMWVANQKDPELFQLPMIADFLNCTVMELIVMEAKEYASTPHHVE